MAHEERSIDGCVCEEPPLSPLAFEEVLSRADPNGVITWLKLVGEPRVDAFWRKYSFPSQVCIAFPFSGSQFVAYTNIV